MVPAQSPGLRRPLFTDSLRLDVPFYDVDSCNVVWHGHYAKYFERARCQLLDRVGYNYLDMQRDGYFFPVVDMQVRYIQPLTFTQAFHIETTLAEWENRLVMKYLVRDGDSGERLTRGSTTQVAVNRADNQLLFDCPPELVQKVERAMARLRG